MLPSPKHRLAVRLRHKCLFQVTVPQARGPAWLSRSQERPHLGQARGQHKSPVQWDGQRAGPAGTGGSRDMRLAVHQPPAHPENPQGVQAGSPRAGLGGRWVLGALLWNSAIPSDPSVHPARRKGLPRAKSHAGSWLPHLRRVRRARASEDLGRGSGGSPRTWSGLG